MRTIAQEVGARLLEKKKKPGLLRREAELQVAERERQEATDSIVRADRGSPQLRFASDAKVRRAAAALRRQQALRRR